MSLGGIIESEPSDEEEQMDTQEQPELLWVVVKVESGIPGMVEAHRDEQSAKIRERSLRRHMHPENDETSVFEVEVGYESPVEL